MRSCLNSPSRQIKKHKNDSPQDCTRLEAITDNDGLIPLQHMSKRTPLTAVKALWGYDTVVNVDFKVTVGYWNNYYTLIQNIEYTC